jgi:acetolactate synthase-1/2/3 large subunit
MIKRMRQKLSDYIADFLAGQGIRHVFIVSGGASIHILHSLHQRNGIQPICPHHEQAGAMAADAYARVTGGLGCAVGTSGPGATNMITGIAGAWFDSIPTLFLTGQVTTFRQKGDSGVRQFGFQETDIVPMVTPITKYCVQLHNPSRIRYELEKAVHIAFSGRPGPVLIDIPDDLQRGFIETDSLVAFSPPAIEARPAPRVDEINAVIDFLRLAHRPIIVLGHGVRLSGATIDAHNLVESCNSPVMTSWGAKDILPGTHRLNAGVFGTHGTRAGNFVVQNADCILAIGARLSTRETGAPLTSWAREARTIIVDIDPAELRKFARFERNLDLAINADAGETIRALKNAIAAVKGSGELPDWSAWHQDIADWYRRYPVCPPEAWKETTINPYALMEVLSRLVPENANLFIDTGCAVAWSMQGFRVRGSQRTFHDFNNTAMGWALPASIGGAFARPNVPTICLVGDGAFMMNLQELATLNYHRLPIKILLIDNGGYSMVRQTEQQWLGGINVGTSTESGLGFPDFMALAKSFGVPAFELTKNSDLADGLARAFAEPGGCLVRIELPPEKGVVPQVAFGYPIEDSEPHLPREEFLRNMKVAPLPVSLKPIN